MAYENEQDNRATVAFWRKWIDLSKKASKKHFMESRLGWAEYEGDRQEMSSAFLQPLDKIKDSYPIYWASVKTIEPAFYSRTPKIISKRKFGLRDAISLTASTVIERLAQDLVQRSNFDSVMMAAVGDFIHADKATNQVKYSAELKPERVQVIPLTDDLTDFMTLTGEPIDPSAEVFKDDQGYFINGDDIADEDTQRITIAPLSFDEVLHTPDAASQDEIIDMAFKFYMLRDEAEKRFSHINPEDIRWKRTKSDDDDERERDTDLRLDSTDEYLEGYECWCIKSKKAYWYSEQYHDLLDIKDDPYGLVGTFPAPDFIIGSKPSKSLYPTPAYLKLYPLIRELHKIQEKIPTLIDSIRRRALVDGPEELILALNHAESAEYVSAEGALRAVVEKGGIQSMVWFVPVQELVQSITELNALTEKFKQEFFEFFGVPDIMRGQAEPMNAAATNQMMVNAAHDRFRYMKKQVRELARDSIEIMVDLALKVYSDEKIAQIVGYQYMTEQEQQRFPMALQMLRDDKARIIHLDIETDSMAFIDEVAEAQKMRDVSAIVTEGIAKVAEIMQINPSLAIVPLNIMLMSLENIAPGRAIMDDIRQQINDMIEDAKQAKANPPPPPPDYEQMKLEIKGQELQLKSQIESAKLQSENFKNQLALQKQYADERVQGIKAEQESYKIQQEQMRINLEQVVQQFMMQLENTRVQQENLRVQIEFFRTQAQATERQMEEIRLAREVDTNARLGLIEALKPQQQEQKEAPPPAVINLQSPPVNVNIDARRPGKRRSNIIMDELGGATIDTMDLDEL